MATSRTLNGAVVLDAFTDPRSGARWAVAGLDAQVLRDLRGVVERSVAAGPVPAGPADPGGGARPGATSEGSATSLSAERIRSAVLSSRDRFDGCVAAAGRSGEVKLDGRTLRLRLLLLPSGTARYPVLDDPSIAGTELARCLAAATGSMAFPKFTGAPVKVEVPLVLGRDACEVELPVMSPSSSGAREKLTTKEITDAVALRLDDLRKCVAAQKSREPSGSGELRVRWFIQGDGGVRGVKALPGKHAPGPFADCVTGVVRTMTFPQSDGPGQEVTFPFAF